MTTQTATREQAAILNAIATYTSTAGQWIPLTWIREEAGLIRADFDTAMSELVQDQTVVLVPEENQKTRTFADEDAALVIGGEAKHLVCLA